jgi:hypothetical protein
MFSRCHLQGRIVPWLVFSLDGLFFRFCFSPGQAKKTNNSLFLFLLLFRSFVSKPLKATFYKASSPFCVPSLGPTVPTLVPFVPSLGQWCASLSEMCL